MHFLCLPCQCWPEEKAARRVTRRYCSSLPAFFFHLTARSELKPRTIRKSLAQARRDGGMCYLPAIRAWRGSTILFSRNLCLMLRNCILSSVCRHWIQALCSAINSSLGAKNETKPRCGSLVGVKLNLDVNITTLHLNKLLKCMGLIWPGDSAKMKFFVCLWILVSRVGITVAGECLREINQK